MLLVGSGCALTPQMDPPDAEAQLPDAYDTPLVEGGPLYAEDDSTRFNPVNWWTAFDAPALNALIDTALVRNLDLERTRAVVDEIASQFRIARAPLFPQATANGNYNRQSQPANTGIGGALGGGGGSGAVPDRFTFDTYSLSLSLSYELDFWGRLRNQRGAALERFMGSVDAVQTARQQVIAQTISTYFEVAALERQIALGEETIRVLQQRVDLAEDRYDRGLVRSFEVYALRQELQAAQAEQPQRESQLADARGRLSVILGQFVGNVDEAVMQAARSAPRDAVLADLQPVPPGLPSDLLMARPDVRADARELNAAQREIGVARANRLPSFSLTGEGGVQNSTLDDLLNIDQRFTTLIASVAAPVFQAGRLRAEQDAAEARYTQARATYEQTLLTALQEVHAALTAYEKQQEQYALVRDQLEQAEASAYNQMRRYERGIGDYATALDAERTRLQAEQRLTAAEEALVGSRIALHRALGGAWVAPPESDDPRLFRGTYRPDGAADTAN
ncbi:transporter [Longimonas halophila]|uniref:Transporter n=2 Tax=Longimonas halophila TaxID=1469170 RepID=A0A2H3NMZ8_9BACT|nr:transporter [Longimonas halophila]